MGNICEIVDWSLIKYRNHEERESERKYIKPKKKLGFLDGGSRTVEN